MAWASPIQITPGNFDNDPDGSPIFPSDSLEILVDLDSFFLTGLYQANCPSLDVTSYQVAEAIENQYGEGSLLIEMKDSFREELLAAYESDKPWKKVKQLILIRKNPEDTTDGVMFTTNNGIIYYTPNRGMKKLVIPWSIEKKRYRMAHDEQHHCGFHRAYTRLSTSIYIRHMAKSLRKYIQYCRACQKNQTMRHAPYGQLKPIVTLALPFHTITLDFILALPPSPTGMDNLLTCTCKFSKRVWVAMNGYFAICENNRALTSRDLNLPLLFQAQAQALRPSVKAGSFWGRSKMGRLLIITLPRLLLEISLLGSSQGFFLRWLMQEALSKKQLLGVSTRL